MDSTSPDTHLCLHVPQNLMREYMRNNDRALSNIEALPGGFNALRQLYENVQVWSIPYGQAAVLCLVSLCELYCSVVMRDQGIVLDRTVLSETQCIAWMYEDGCCFTDILASGV